MKMDWLVLTESISGSSCLNRRLANPAPLISEIWRKIQKFGARRQTHTTESLAYPMIRVAVRQFASNLMLLHSTEVIFTEQHGR